MGRISGSRADECVLQCPCENEPASRRARELVGKSDFQAAPAINTFTLSIEKK
jgi:hypothetical protein